MNVVFNRPDQTAKRRALRNELPPAERLLWAQIRGGITGAKFRRQVSVGAYVLDFYSPALRLAIEVDGLTHVGDEAAAYDAVRQSEIEALGIEFMRFSNGEVYQQLEGVVETIAARVKARGAEMGLELKPFGGSNPRRVSRGSGAGGDGLNPLWALPISPSERGRTSDELDDSVENNATVMSSEGTDGLNPLWASPISPSERGRTSESVENSTPMSIGTQNSKQNSPPTNIKPTKDKLALPLSEGEMGEAQRGFNSK